MSCSTACEMRVFCRLSEEVGRCWWAGDIIRLTFFTLHWAGNRAPNVIISITMHFPEHDDKALERSDSIKSSWSMDEVYHKFMTRKLPTHMSSINFLSMLMMMMYWIHRVAWKLCRLKRVNYMSATWSLRVLINCDIFIRTIIAPDTLPKFLLVLLVKCN